jgi:hypothetical protein
MQGLIIKDSEDGFLTFDLKEIFSAIGEPVVTSTWRCRSVECVGENADRLQELAAEDQSVSGQELVDIVSGVFQTIDGEFEAYREGKKKPWLVVNAVDSSWFEVLTLDPFVLEKVKQSFREVSLLSETAA